MFIVFLRFSSQKDKAPSLMEVHRKWIAQGFADGVFQLAGSLQPEGGGAIIAVDFSREALEKRLHEDPFVIGDVVTAEIQEIEAAKTDPRLAFLLQS